jgi:hypothetical protein
LNGNRAASLQEFGILPASTLSAMSKCKLITLFHRNNPQAERSLGG